MWEVLIYTGDMYSYSFVFEYMDDVCDFIKAALINTTDDLEVNVKQIKKGGD